MGDRSAFFYGTLMAPEVLHRVVHGTPNPEPWQSSLLTFKPAILPAYTRHRVRHCDYPAITPTPQKTASVRGTLVTGLTPGDIWRLDIFEGSEYERRKIRVRILEHEGNAKTGEGNVEGTEVEAEAYVWISDPEGLEEGEWDFSNFRKEKMGRWVGADVEDEGLQGRTKKAHYILEVDAAVAAMQADPTGGRGLNGSITSQLEGSRQIEHDVEA